MYELIQVGERTYYIECPTKIGIFLLNETEVCLIDSGNDKDTAKKVLKILDEKGWELNSIINTHSHADHIGGNQLLQQRTNCQIYAPDLEEAFIQNTIFEPSFLYGGYAPKDLRNKFLYAHPSKINNITTFNITKDLEFIFLPGHSFQMIGVRTCDDVIFLADSISSEIVLNKYQISFLYDVDRFLQSLDKVEDLHAKLFIPSHAEVTDDIKGLVQINREKVYEVIDKILSTCENEICFEDLLQALFTEYELKMNFTQYVLIGSTIRSYLAYLKDTGKLTVIFEQNKLLWKRV